MTEEIWKWINTVHLWVTFVKVRPCESTAVYSRALLKVFTKLLLFSVQREVYLQATFTDSQLALLISLYLCPYSSLFWFSTVSFLMYCENYGECCLNSSHRSLLCGWKNNVLNWAFQIDILVLRAIRYFFIILKYYKDHLNSTHTARETNIYVIGFQGSS